MKGKYISISLAYRVYTNLLKSQKIYLLKPIRTKFNDNLLISISLSRSLLISQIVANISVKTAGVKRL